MPHTICGRCAAAGLRPTQYKLSPKTGWTLDVEFRRRNYNSFLVGQTFAHPYNQIALRYASSSTSSKKKSLEQKQKPSSALADVNPPASTLPPDLHLPPKLPNNASLQQKLSRMLAMGRGYFQFYKTGIKSVYNNHKASLALRAALGLPRLLPTSMPPARGHRGPWTSTLVAQLEQLGISRADMQLVRRSAYDMRRMLPFCLVLLICGELTPLVVLALGNAITPYACRLPQQIDKTRQKRIQLKRQALLATQADLGSATPIQSGSDEEMEWLAQNFGAREFASSKGATASPSSVLRACASFGLVKSLDRPAWLVPLIYRPRLVRYTEYLELDDVMLLKGGGVDGLSAEEVRIAVDERGGGSLDDSQLDGGFRDARDREWLARWLAARSKMLRSES